MDISTGPIADNSKGTHEITLGYDFISDEDLIQEVSDNGLVSDQDKDGVNDEDDMCPTESGDPNANGCPDFDKDGVPDKFDLCPHLFGNIEVQGCPELTVDERVILSDALADFNFSQGQYEIEYESYGALSKLAVLMHTNPNMYLRIEGFASSEGTESYNLSLSAKRAKSVQNFFIERGIERSRLVMDFYGEESPLNSNFTEKERAENRRVEFDIRYHLQNLNTANNLKSEYNALLAKLNGEKSNPIDDRYRKK
jgi:outer membrane protein OmpA-like peptidoglycan-associated protein